MPELISIIIPFYNEEQYLERAVRSALAQSYTPVEIILVNDGSTDKSPEQARDLCIAHPNVTLIHITNGGPGIARNAGMAKASGVYLTFLDGDDTMTPDAIALWQRQIKENDADIVIGKFRMKPAHNNEEWVLGWKGTGQRGTGDDGVHAMYEYRMSSTVWAKLYRSDIAKTLRFPEGLWFEDRFFLLSYFLRSERIAFEPEAGLDILSREGSITRRLLSEGRIRAACRVYRSEQELVKDHVHHIAYTRLIDRHQINVLLELMIILYFDKAQLADDKAIRKCLSEHIMASLQQIQRQGTRLGLRDRLDVLLLQLHRWLGWSFVFVVLPFWKRKKCRSVQVLKSF